MKSEGAAATEDATARILEQHPRGFRNTLPASIHGVQHFLAAKESWLQPPSACTKVHVCMHKLVLSQDTVNTSYACM